MQIAYYMPFKPMGHHNPSGDLVTGSEIFAHLRQSGHDLQLVSRLRCRWIYYRPLALLRLLAERRRILAAYRGTSPSLWLSYHSYYKAPDLLGPSCSRRLGIPYAIFQGIYSTSRRRQVHTLPGFLLNRATLLAADLVFSNKKRDLKNLARLLPPERLSYIAPGIHPEQFSHDPAWREQLRRNWGMADKTVVMSAAMLRPGVKTAGIATVIRACHDLYRAGLDLTLVIAGDGSGRGELERLGQSLPPERIRFLGKVPRPELHRYYSAADIFAFPGIEESLGMVYLEAQSCRLPVVACGDWGGGEAVVAGETGLLSPFADPEQFTANLARLAREPLLRQRFGEEAERHVRLRHDLHRNYIALEQGLCQLAAQRGKRPTPLLP
jgi:glycosyltransferase involved in cell wall biosynthesis